MIHGGIVHRFFLARQGNSGNRQQQMTGRVAGLEEIVAGIFVSLFYDKSG